MSRNKREAFSVDDLRNYLLEKFYLSITKESGEEERTRRKHQKEKKPSVTALIYECMRRAYYQLTIPERSISPQGAVRAWVGRECHKTDILGGEMELSLEWEGITGRIDEYDPERKLLLDKKTTRVIPREPWSHHITQCEYYKILLEENERPVDEGVLCYINVDNGTIQNYPVRFRNSEEIKKEMLEKKRTLQECLNSGILPPRKIRTWDPGGINIVCSYCVKPDTIIPGDFKPISQYSINDKVIGFNEDQRVSNVFSRPYNGNLIKIKAMGLLPIECTPEHPIFIVRKERKRDADKWSDKWNKFFPSISWEFGQIQTKTAQQIAKDFIHNSHKRKMRSKDYLIIPRIKGTFSNNFLDLKNFTTPHGVKVSIGKGQNLMFPINYRTAWLLGLYVAEGYRDSLILGSHEIELINKVADIVEELGFTRPKPFYGLNCNRSSAQINLQSRILTRLFETSCGQGAANKRIPNFIFRHTDNNIINSFIKGYIEGDGCVFNGNLLGGGASRVLSLQFQLLFARMGKLASINICPPKETIMGRKVKKPRPSYSLAVYKSTQAKIYNNYILVPTTKIEVYPYRGNVFNLQTSDEGYLVSNALVHNCSYFGLCVSEDGPDPRWKREPFFERDEVFDILRNIRIEKLTVEHAPLAVSGIVSEKEKTYSAFLVENERTCSCKGQTVWKGICKHLIALALECYLSQRVSFEEMEKLLRRR